MDLDPQGGVGHSLKTGDTELAGLADLLAGACSPNDAVCPTRLGDALAAPHEGRLDAVDIGAFEGALHEPGELADALATASATMDFTVIDSVRPRHRDPRRVQAG